MTRRIAIQPDHFRHRNGEEQSFSDRWTELAEGAGIEVEPVDVHAPDIVEQIAGCDGFMWRPVAGPASHDLSRRLLPAVEIGLGIPVFPSWRTLWHSEDKTAQNFLLRSAGLPMARTWVFWRLDDALAFCRTATYPLVMKLGGGIQSGGVQLLRDAAEATYWARRMFSTGATSFDQKSRMKLALAGQIQGLRLLAGGSLPSGLERRYFYVQEFLPDNPFDTRITVIGDRAFGFRRFNRPNDFRASGSGRLHWEPDAIDPGFVRLAFRLAQSLGTQSVGVDFLYRGAERIVVETTFAYASWCVHACPGYWKLQGDPDEGELAWQDGRMRPEDAIFEDFLAELRGR